MPVDADKRTGVSSNEGCIRFFLIGFAPSSAIAILEFAPVPLSCFKLIDLLRLWPTRDRRGGVLAPSGIPSVSVSVPSVSPSPSLIAGLGGVEYFPGSESAAFWRLTGFLNCLPATGG